MLYPDTFYGEGNFGLWDCRDPRVQADCELVLALVRSYHDFPDDLSAVMIRRGHRRFREMWMWAVDRCTFDAPVPWSDHDGAKGSPAHHWHTERALANWQENNRNHDTRRNDFDHAVPRAYVRAEVVSQVCDDKVKTWEHMRDLLRPVMAMAVLTKEEHKKLGNTKNTDGIRLNAYMPTGWTWGGNPFARYEAAGILLLPPTLWPQDRRLAVINGV